MQQHEFTTGQIRPIECVKEAFAMIKPDYWLLFAISFLGAMIGGVSMYILIGAMICGIFISYLRVIDGGRASIDDLWLGFKYLGKSAFVTILFVVPIVVYIFALFFTMYMPLIVAAVGGKRVSEREILAGLGFALVIDLIIALIMVSLHTLLLFSFPLIVDRGLSSMDSVKVSARAVWGNLGGVTGLIAVNFGLIIVGYAAFCIGLYLVIPVLTATSLVAYRKVFPRLAQANLDPPSPATYQSF